jgi:hypothetical protein
MNLAEPQAAISTLVDRGGGFDAYTWSSPAPAFTTALSTTCVPLGGHVRN